MLSSALASGYRGEGADVVCTPEEMRAGVAFVNSNLGMIGQLPS